jgi:Fe-S-cluster-containing hydrogenase component 2/CRP-like cAMP-binding protein
MSDPTGTVRMRARQHRDRWESFGEHAGIEEFAGQPSVSRLRQIELLAEFDDALLEELSPDLSIAKWQPGATIFEAGSYIDLAFHILGGEVELTLPVGETAHPIFTTRGAAVPRQVQPAAALPAIGRPARRDSIAFLAAADFDLAPGERLNLHRGDVFGEIGAMNGWPQSVAARTRTQCALLQIRLPALRKIRRKSKRLKKLLDDAYRTRTLRQHLRSTPLLAGCDAATIDKLAASVDLVSCQPGDTVTTEGQPVEHLILVRSGSLRVTQSIGAGQLAIGYASKGSTVGESELVLEQSPTWQVSTASVSHSELVTIPREEVARLVEHNPVVQQRLFQAAAAGVSEMAARRGDLARADLMDFSIEKGIIQGNSVLVLDLESCTRCDDCVRGCASTHGGTARFVREGEVYAGFLVARSCYHCQDPTCLVGCPTGAISRVNIGDTVAIDPSICIGCGACAEKCPYDSIIIHDLGTTWGPDALPKDLRGEPRAVATKCDLCLGAVEGPACVASCPHGAAHRVAGAEEFDALISLKRRGAFAT